MTDWSQDLVLRALQDLEEPVGSLVHAYPGRARLADDPQWLESWFVDLARRFAAGQGPDPKTIIASASEKGALSLLAKQPVDASLRLISIRPYFFRGFRDVPSPILLDADLVVIEGRNSSGKTSLSEAIEWVFTGELSRRTSGQHGHPTELAGCIANEFCPAGTQPRVELTLAVNGERLVLVRLLDRDYSSTASDRPVSELSSSGTRLTSRQEQQLRERLLAGVHPILMQHNLRRFVHDDPDARRQYFERLLQIDELTGLIEKAVIGPKGIQQLPNPDGGAGLAALRALISEVERDPEVGAKGLVPRLRKLERTESEKIPDALAPLLVLVAQTAFKDQVAGVQGLAQHRDRLTEAQRAQREARLPLLSDLERARSHELPSLTDVGADLANLSEAWSSLAAAKAAAGTISDAQREVARAIDALIAAGLIDVNQSDPQTCPLCESVPGTLQPERVTELTSWTPLAKALDEAEHAARNAQEGIHRKLQEVRESTSAVVPPQIGPEIVEKQLAGSSQRVVALTRSALESAAALRICSEAARDAVTALDGGVRRKDTKTADLQRQLRTAREALEALTSSSAVHREDVSHLEEAVGAASRDDAAYRLRERWLELSGLTTGLADDVAWERAKAQASDALDGLRDGLIALRKEIIEDARRTFSDEMTSIWHLLRSDSGAQFKRLHIPPARGRGYKLAFELKALISDGVSEPEVEALRVFSESQVNVVGIAAYITRAKLLGHRLLIFDDPVQSMDEEHFRSFAARLLPTLIDDGFQVIILTHSDTFARRIHDSHYPRESFATMETRASRRKGCYVEEGNRRVSERLKNARRMAEDGDLPAGWRLVRLATERMYTLAKAREDDKFDPESWRNLTAEDMWEKGVGDIVARRAPDAGKRLKEILRATAIGAHDKAATSETELVDATRDLAALLSPLRLGAG
jgi:DNA repair exonuclease SbcCD ATPase subunit